MILANDARGDLTPGSDIMRGTTLVPDPEPLALECGCASADAFARLT